MVITSGRYAPSGITMNMSHPIECQNMAKHYSFQTIHLSTSRRHYYSISNVVVQKVTPLLTKMKACVEEGTLMLA